MKKIRIIGTCGSGKSYLAKELSKKLKIPHYDLDDIFWKKKYTKRREEKEMKKMVNKTMKKNKWIIEGIQYYNHNIEKTFKKADLILWLKTKTTTSCYRIIRRYITRKNEKQENAKNTLKLLKSPILYNLNIKSKSKKTHREISNKYKKKLIILKNKKQINEFLKSIK